MAYLPPRRRAKGKIYLALLVRQFVERRHALKRSQAEIDHRLGCADRLISKFECGLRSPGLYMAMLWADTLDCDLVLVPREISYAHPLAQVRQQVRREQGEGRWPQLRQPGRSHPLLRP